MFCTKCGKQLDEGIKFCTACGSPVPVKQKLEVVDEVREADEATETVEVTGTVKAARSNEAADTAGTLEEVSAQETDKTVALGSATEEDSDAEDDALDLPDSALEPQIPESVDVSARIASAETTSMDVAESAEVNANGIETDLEDDEDSDPVSATKRPSPKGARNRVIAICSAVAVILAAAVGVFVVLDPLNPNTPIDADAFPNDVIRGAVIDQLDVDGDGRLSNEEAQSVTALVLTPEGAEFVTEGNEVDVQAIRDRIAANASDAGDNAGSDAGQVGDLGSAGQETADQGAREDVDQSEGSSSTSVPAIGDELSSFVNLKTLVATGCDLNEVYLSAIPSLEYVDLRDNPDLVTFDLSGNRNIKVLFCDENTGTTGLEEAGLYFTDLVTNMQVSGGSSEETFAVEYDTQGRPTSVTQTFGKNSKTRTEYGYDEAGRLVGVEQLDTSGTGWFESYEYGSNGLLSAASTHCKVDVTSVVDEYAYGYDEAGRVTQFAIGESKKGSEGKHFNGAGAFAYLDGKLAAYKCANDDSAYRDDEATVYSIGDNGLLASACKSDEGSQTTISCAYGPSGALVSYTSVDTSLFGTAKSAEDSTEYSETGSPISSTVDVNGSSTQVTYECNADGYITSIQWSSGNYNMAGSTGKLSYVKRVGALADRASQRYVPVVRPVLYATDLQQQNSWAPLRNWFHSTALNSPITVYVSGPMDVASEHMGLQSNMLENPNELALAAYDREHWTDGLDLSGAQPIDDAGVNELLAKAEQIPLPVPARSFLDDPVYGPVVKEYLDAAKNVDANWRMSIPTDSDTKYPDVPMPVLQMMSYHLNPGGYSDIGVIDFAYADLNGDGVNELVVTMPSSYEYSSKGNGGAKQVNVVAVYGQANGKPKLIANAAERLQCWVIANGDVVTFGGGAMYGAYSIYRWNGTEVQEAGKIEYDRVSSEGSETWDLTAKTDNGSVQNQTVAVGVLEQKVKELLGGNEYAQFAWTPISTL